LRILRHLIRKPDQTVSAVAAALGFPVSLTSNYLRILNARGLLRVRRESRWVMYRVGPDPSVPDTRELVAALQGSLRGRRDRTKSVFRAATAFTHVRREQIFRLLAREGVLRPSVIRVRTGISKDALSRHLEKLRSRRMIVRVTSGYACARPQGPLAATLARLATHGRQSV
jgi:DNA-binding transcriptional ArsR family regulator